MSSTLDDILKKTDYFTPQQSMIALLEHLRGDDKLRVLVPLIESLIENQNKLLEQIESNVKVPPLDTSVIESLLSELVDKELPKLEIPKYPDFPKVQKVEVLNSPEFPKFPDFPEVDLTQTNKLLLSLLQAIKDIPEPPKTVTLVDENGRPINLSKLVKPEEKERRISLGGKGGGMTFTAVDDETPTGAINGSNTVFTLSRTPQTGSLKLYLNGARQRVTEDYTFSGLTITFIIAPPSTSILLADYKI